MHTSLTALEVIKIFLGDYSLIHNGSTICQAEIGKDPECSQQILEANSKGFHSAIIQKQKNSDF